METHTVQLASKPGAALHISTYLPSADVSGPYSRSLVVFLNGLMLPRAGWLPAIEKFLSARKQTGQPIPPMLAFDRYGQGDSDPDPTDLPGTPYGHDAQASVVDLNHLLIQVARAILGASLSDIGLLFVCNSIGCALGRMYAVQHPGSVAGLLFLDSMMANTDFVSLFPDPEATDFDPSQLPEGVSVDDIIHSRRMYAELFHPTVPNGEHLDRRNLPELLPDSDRPQLPSGPGGKAPHLVIVGHDWDEFAKQSEEGTIKVPKAVTNAYINPAWAKYNAGLARLIEEGPIDVKTATGCGHFIQRDDPAFVANELGRALDRSLCLSDLLPETKVQS